MHFAGLWAGDPHLLLNKHTNTHIRWDSKWTTDVHWLDLMHLQDRNTDYYGNCPEELFLCITSIRRAPSRPSFPHNNSRTNGRTTGRDFSSHPLSSLIWFPFLYSNMFGFRRVGRCPHAACRAAAVCKWTVSLLCWRAGRRGHCLSVTGFVRYVS